MELIAINHIWWIVLIIALDDVVIDSTTVLCILEVWIKCIDKALASVSSVSFIHKVS